MLNTGMRFTTNWNAIQCPVTRNLSVYRFINFALQLKKTSISSTFSLLLDYSHLLSMNAPGTAGKGSNTVYHCVLCFNSP